MTDMGNAEDAPDISAHPSASPVTPAASAASPSASPPPPRGAELERLRRRTTAVLVASQMLGGLGVTTAIALAAVLAKEISHSEALSGLASTASVVGTALFALPLASLMSARGRRAGLTVAYAVGAAGGAVVVAGAVLGSFPLLLAGMVAFGASSSAGLQARYAAADLAEPDRRARAISLVVWSTTVGAVLGPNIAAPAGSSVAGLGVPATAGPFVWGSAVFLVTGVLIHLLLRPDPLLTARALAEAEDTAAAAAGAAAGADGEKERAAAAARDRSLRAGLAAVAASSHARLALVTIAVAHTAMISVMVMTPVALGRHGAGIELIGLVISVHILGMYAFSPLTGWLADRFGRVPVILLGVVLIAAAAALAGSAGGSHTQTGTGLFLLGLGWSACLVSGSALLTDSVPQPARAAVQGLSELTMNASAGICGALAGLVMSTLGYGWLSALAASLLLPVLALALPALTRGGGSGGKSGGRTDDRNGNSSDSSDSAAGGGSPGVTAERPRK